MGNTSRKLKKSSTSTAQDALSGQPPDNRNYVSVKSSFGDVLPDESVSISEHIGQFESPQQLNFYSLHASFLAQFFNSTKVDRQSDSQSFYEVVKSHLWSIHSLEYVTMCALNILSLLKVYGGCVPPDSEMINMKSQFMFLILDKLHAHISQMKSGSWHSGNESLYQSCHGCDTKAMVLKHIVFRNSCAKDTFCLICLEFVPKQTPYLEHSNLDKHKQVELELIEGIFPYPCPGCEQRFSSLHVLKQHRESHSSPIKNVETAGNDNLTFKPVCCYLCCISFPNAKHLKEHELKSLEHGSRKELAMEVALRNRYAVDKLGKSTNSDSHIVQSNSSANLLSELIFQSKLESPTDVISISSKNCKDDSCDAKDVKLKMGTELYYCDVCGTHVPKSGVVIHEKGRKHREVCEKWVSHIRECGQSRGDQGTVLTPQFLNGDQDLSVSEKALTIEFSNEKESMNMPGCFDETYMSTASDHDGGVSECEGGVMECENYYCNPCAMNIPKDQEGTHENGKGHKNNLSFLLRKSSTTEISDEQVKRKIEEYLSLEKPIVYKEASSDDYYVCGECYVRCRYNVMLQHVLARRHLSIHQSLDQNTYDKKLRLLEFLMSIRLEKWTILKVLNKESDKKFIEFTSHLLKGAVDLEQSTSSLRPQITDCLPHDMEKLERILSDKLCPFSGSSQSSCQSQISDDIGCSSLQTEIASHWLDIVPVPKDDLSDRRKDASSSCISQISFEDLKAESEPEGDLGSQPKTFMIGEKSGTTLQEEFYHVYPGNNINNFEALCSACGVTFQIYNEDLDFSFDEHVQSDPQHALATEVPAERDPQRMAESAKTINLSSLLKTDKALVSCKKVSGNSVILNPRGKRVIEELISLEHNNITILKEKYCCKLCKVFLSSKCQFAHHLLSDKHLSVNWMKGLSCQQMMDRIDALSALLKYSYAQRHLLSAVDRINALLTKCAPSWEGYWPGLAYSSKNSENSIASPITNDAGSKSSSKGNAAYYCQLCSKNLSKMSLRSRKQHEHSCKLKVKKGSAAKPHTRNVDPSFVPPVNSVLSHVEKKN